MIGSFVESSGFVRRSEETSNECRCSNDTGRTGSGDHQRPYRSRRRCSQPSFWRTSFVDRSSVGCCSAAGKRFCSDYPPCHGISTTDGQPFPYAVTDEPSQSGTAARAHGGSARAGRPSLPASEFTVTYAIRIFSSSADPDAAAVLLCGASGSEQSCFERVVLPANLLRLVTAWNHQPQLPCSCCTAGISGDAQNTPAAGTTTELSLRVSGESLEVMCGRLFLCQPVYWNEQRHV